MRFYEILSEGGLKYNDKLKHYGKYALMVIDAIKEGEPWPIDPTERKKLGIDEVYIKPESAQAFQDALYQGPYRELINYKRDAIDWFKNQSYD